MSEKLRTFARALCLFTLGVLVMAGPPGAHDRWVCLSGASSPDICPECGSKFVVWVEQAAGVIKARKSKPAATAADAIKALNPGARIQSADPIPAPQGAAQVGSK